MSLPDCAPVSTHHEFDEVRHHGVEQREQPLPVDGEQRVKDVGDAGDDERVLVVLVDQLLLHLLHGGRRRHGAGPSEAARVG